MTHIKAAFVPGQAHRTCTGPNQRMSPSDANRHGHSHILACLLDGRSFEEQSQRRLN